jgi:hypothetical protein
LAARAGSINTRRRPRLPRLGSVYSQPTEHVARMLDAVMTRHAGVRVRVCGCIT